MIIDIKQGLYSGVLIKCKKNHMNFKKNTIIIVLAIACFLCKMVFSAEKPPRNLSVTPGGLGDDFVALFWDKPDPNNNSTVTGYSVIQNGIEVVKTTKMHVFVTGLTPSTNYQFAIRADGSGGQSPNSQLLQVTTKPKARVFNVLDYGAKGDGVTDDWAALKAAFDACTPGGKVFFPGNKQYSTGTLRISKSNIFVQLGDNAVIQVNPAKKLVPYGDTSYFKIRACGSTDADKMPMLMFVGDLPHRTTPTFKTESQKRVVTDVCIYGKGFIFGSSVKGGVHDTRVALTATQRASRILWYGLTLYGGEGWMNTIDYSDNISIMDCKIGNLNPKVDRSPWSGRDGWNPVFSSYCYFMGCEFATGDDCLALKTEKRTGDPQYNQNLPLVEGTGSTHHIRITNCGFYHSGTAQGITFGSEITNGVSDVFIQDCEGIGILYKGSPDRGGYIRNIVVKDTRMALEGFTYYWGFVNPGPMPNDISNSLFENCTFVSIKGGTVPNQPLKSFTFINCSASYECILQGPCENWNFFNCDTKMNAGAPSGTTISQSVPINFKRLEVAFQGESSQKNNSNVKSVLRDVNSSRIKRVSLDGKVIKIENVKHPYRAKFPGRVILEANKDSGKGLQYIVIDN